MTKQRILFITTGGTIASVQALLITLFVVFDALIIYILYKKVIYKHLDNIKKNIEELKDICTE